MTVTPQPVPDPRYGYPVKMTQDGETHSAYYLGESKWTDAPYSYHFVSDDPAWLSRFDDSRYEVRVITTSLEGVEFLAAPHIGEPPTKIEFINGNVFVNRKNIAHEIQTACERFHISKPDVSMLTDQDDKPLFDITFDAPDSQLVKILATNTLKRLGIWEASKLTVTHDPFGVHGRRLW